MTLEEDMSSKFNSRASTIVCELQKPSSKSKQDDSTNKSISETLISDVCNQQEKGPHLKSKLIEDLKMI